MDRQTNPIPQRGCTLCHSADGTHRETCPTLIRVEWKSSGSVWETLARRLFEMFENAEYAAIVDRGTAEAERDLDVFVRHCKQALEDGDPYTVLELIKIREG